MKRSLCLGVILMLLLVPASYASFDGIMKSQSSGEQDSDTQIYTGDCAITAVHLIADGTNQAKITVHDGTANSDKVLGEYVVPAGEFYNGRVWVFPVVVKTGIYVDVSGTGASYIIEYFYK